MKRFACMFLAVLMLLTMIPVALPVSAAETYGMRDLKKGETYTTMKSSQELIDVIKDFEGFSATPYKDNTQWTVGYGSYCGDSSDPRPSIRLTEAQAETRLRKDLTKTYEPIVNNYCKSIGKQPNQQQFDALVDLTYNLGGSWTTGNAVTSVLKNDCTALELVKGFGAYSRTGGSVSYVHVNRRIREALMFLYGEYYRAYGNQDCQSSIGVLSNDDLPHYKVMIFKSGSGKFANGKTDYADYYAEGEYFGSFPQPTRSGYTLVGWKITKRSNKSVSGGERISIWDTVEENLELTAVWEKGTFEVAPEEPPEDYVDPNEPELEQLPEVEIDMDRLPFDDVPDNAWFREAVSYVYRNEFMNGTSSSTFAPGASMTRGMLVTVLYRIDGSVSVTDEERACFDDIQGAYYTDAVAWAYSNGIVNGVSENTFEPNRVVTRQEAVTIFYRYCVDYNLMGVEAGLELDGFDDQEQVAGFATDAFAWAVSIGLVEGSADGDGCYLNPASNLNRAQAAILLQRCVEDIM